MKFVYTVWLSDRSLPSDDPESEWPACFIIESGGPQASAKAWGDHLAGRYASSNGQDFVRSTAEPIEASTLPGLDALPVIMDGEEASNDKIGW